MIEKKYNYYTELAFAKANLAAAKAVLADREEKAVSGGGWYFRQNMAKVQDAYKDVCCHRADVRRIERDLADWQSAVEEEDALILQRMERHMELAAEDIPF